MRSWVSFFVIGSVLAAGCQQRDGPLPARDSQTVNRLNDMKRDLENIAAGDRGAPADLMDDLAVFAESEPEVQAARELGRRVAGVVAAKPLSEDAAVKLVEQLWVAAAARDLSQRQQDGLREAVRELLKSAGAEAAGVESIVTQVGSLQGEVSRRTRRWYERY
jgi:hypothetical protein